MKEHRGHPDAPPPTASDGWGGIREAMVEVYGKVPEYKGRVTGTRSKVVYGEEQQVLELLGEQTAYVERTHLTMRHMNGRLTRKGLGFSKALRMHRAAAAWEDAVYNLTRPIKSLRIDLAGPPPEGYDGPSKKRWEKRTPAMVAGLASRVWSVKELLRTVAASPENNTQ